MPANLTQQYMQAEARFRAAVTHEEKVVGLEEMIRELPKHKHTEKMFADLKTRLSKLKKEGDVSKGPAVRKTAGYEVAREGAGQIVVIGAPNSGKSSILAALTKAPVEVTEYPFTTRRVIPGLMRFEDVGIQIVDTPAIAAEFMDPMLPPFIRSADAAVLCVDLTAPDCLDQAAATMAALAECGIVLRPGIVDSTDSQKSPRPLVAFIAATHADDPDAEIALELLAETVAALPAEPGTSGAANLKIISFSINDPAMQATFCRACFDLFNVVRVYSKQPGKPADKDAPFLVPNGGFVIDFAEMVHRDFRDKFSFARVWGEGKFEGQRVSRDYQVQDCDVIELHLST